MWGHLILFFLLSHVDLRFQHLSSTILGDWDIFYRTLSTDLFMGSHVCQYSGQRASVGTIKDGNGMDLTEAEDIKKRWQEYTEGLYKKDLHDPDNHDGVVTHLEPDILACEVKWALESITTNKASGGDGIPVELFQILKDDAMKVLHSMMPANLQNSKQWPQDWRRSVFIPIPKKGNAKECSNYHTITLISHTSKAMLKILQPRHKQYMNHELAMF